jgi:hypothetical protein
VFAKAQGGCGAVSKQTGIYCCLVISAAAAAAAVAGQAAGQLLGPVQPLHHPQVHLQPGGHLLYLQVHHHPGECCCWCNTLFMYSCQFDSITQQAPPLSQLPYGCALCQQSGNQFHGSGNLQQLQHMHNIMCSRHTDVCCAVHASQVARVTPWPIPAFLNVCIWLTVTPAGWVAAWMRMWMVRMHTAITLIVATTEALMAAGKAVKSGLWYVLERVSTVAQGKSFPASCFLLTAGCTLCGSGRPVSHDSVDSSLALQGLVGAALEGPTLVPSKQQPLQRN